ncbi:hypothetical protein [Brasilonema sp. UFV-L1]|uniref:hypothetical protein n=1 Tax=Brasilonema sp. UFV-L1 TaxID=2234130 RepID=UPI00145F12EF|nr:hypothetical protein [Brasilonema sp. UFV-L1]
MSITAIHAMKQWRGSCDRYILQVLWNGCGNGAGVVQRAYSALSSCHTFRSRAEYTKFVFL